MKRLAGTVVALVTVAITIVAARHGPAGADGGVLRTVPVGRRAVAVAVDARSGRVFIADRDSRDIRVLDATTGDALGQLGLGRDPYALAAASLPLAPAMFTVDPDRDRVYVGTDYDAVLALNGTGQPRGSVRATGLVAITAMAVHAGRVFVVGIGVPAAGLQVDTLDSRSGRLVLVRTAALGGVQPAAGVASGYHGGGVAIAARTGRLFVGSMTHNVLHVVRLSDGVAIGAAQIGTLTAPPVAEAVDDRTGHVFVVTDVGNSVEMADARTGSALRRVFVGGFPVALAVDQRTRRAFVVSRGPVDSGGNPTGAGHGSVAVIDTRTGALLATVSVGVGPGAVAIDVRRERVFIANTGAVDARGVVIDPGSVSVLDARTGMVRETLAVGLAPTAVAVDEQTARAFVVNFGGRAIRDPWKWLPSDVRRRLPSVPKPQTVDVPSTVSVIDAAST